MPNVELLEKFPLYRKLKANIPATLATIPKVPINRDCIRCGGSRTFLMINEYWDEDGYVNASSNGYSSRIIYRCTGCSIHRRIFLVYFSEKNDFVMKCGQIPAWEIKNNKDISNILGVYKDLYIKGLVCESESYGIAAFSYYRRIVEKIIDKLLSEIEELIDDSEKEKYKIALDLTKKTRVTAEKIDLIQDILPAVLRPQNMNPLSLLHGILSEGLHAGTDERCLELAIEAREIIIFLVSRVANASKDAREFTQRMQTLLQKKNKPGSTT